MSLGSKLALVTCAAGLVVCGVVVALLRWNERSSGVPDAAKAPAPVEAAQDPTEGVTADDGTVDPGAATLVGRVFRIDAVGARSPASDARLVVAAVEPAAPVIESDTTPEGRFAVESVPAATRLRLDVNAPGAALLRLEFRLDPGVRVRDLGDLLLEPGADASFLVVDVRGELIPDAEVVVERSSEHPIDVVAHSGVAEAQRLSREVEPGLHVVERVPIGPLRVSARAPGHVPSGPVSFDSPLEQPLTLELLGGHAISGRVVDVEGAPIVGATLAATNIAALRDSRPDSEVRSGSGGHFAFDTLSFGTYVVGVEADGYVPFRVDAILTGSLDLELVLEAGATIRGAVVEAASRRPVTAARVTLEPEQPESEDGEPLVVETTAGGQFERSGLEAGRYLVRVDHDDFATLLVEESVVCEPPAVVDVGVLELGDGVPVRGRVLDGETEEPVTGAEVTLRLLDDERVDSPVTRRVETIAGGVFEANSLRPGRYELRASASAFLRGDGTIVDVGPERPGGDDEVIVILARGATIAGRVLDPGGEPVAGAIVSPRLVMSDEASDLLRGSDRSKFDWEIETRSGLDGSFRLAPLLGGLEYVVLVEHSRYAVAGSPEVEVPDASTVDGVEVRLRRPATIRGVLTDVSGDPLAGVAISSSYRGDDFAASFGRLPQTSATTRGDGSFVLAPLCSGTHRLRVRPEDRPGDVRLVELVEGGTVELDLSMPAGLEIEGRVADESNAPIAGAHVMCHRPVERFASTDGSGRFRLRGLPPRGSVELSFSADGFGYLSESVTLPPDEPLVITLRQQGRLVGVLRATGMRPIEYPVTIDVLSETGTQIRMSASRPRFSLSIPPGTYGVRALASGLAPGRVEGIVVLAGETTGEVVVELDDGGTVRGSVTGSESDEPLANATIHSFVEGEGSSGRASAHTDRDGVFELNGLPPGAVDIVVSHAVHAPSTLEDVEIVDGGVTDVTVALEPGARIEGTVRQGGEPVVGAYVGASRRGQVRRDERSDTTASDGRFVITGLAAGEYLIRGFVQRTEGSTKIPGQDVRVLRGEASSIEIDLPLAVAVTGQVRRGRAPLALVKVAGVPPEGASFPPESTTDATGRYRLELDGPGAYVLEVRPNGYRDVAVRLPLSIVEGQEHVEQDIELAAGLIQGRVVDAASGKALVAAEVVALPPRPGSPGAGLRSVSRGRTVTGSRGRFTLNHVDEGTWSIRVAASGFSDAVVTGIAVADDVADVGTIELEPGLDVSIVVVDERAEPVQAATVELRDGAGRPASLGARGATGADGTVSLTGIRPGAYRLALAHRRLASAVHALEVYRDMERPTLVMRPGGRLRVAVFEVAGEPAAGAALRVLGPARVDVLRDLLLSHRSGVLTGTDGAIELGMLAEGRYSVSALRGETRWEPIAIEVTADSTAWATLRAER